METTKAFNHIVVQIDDSSVSDNTYLRISKCTTVAAYEKECSDMYPNWRPDGLTVFYNAVKWYDRVLTDICYKKFKGFSFEVIKPGIYKISIIDHGTSSVTPSAANDTQDNTAYYVAHDEVIAYIDRKIHSYYEDEAEDVSMINQLSSISAIDFDIRKYVQLDLSSFDPLKIKIPLMEHNRDGEYIPTHHELISFVLYGIQTVMCEMNHDTTLPKTDMVPVEIEICETTGNIYLPKNTFSYPETRYIISKLLRWDGTTDFSIFFRDIIQKPFYQKLIMQLSGLIDTASYTSLPVDASFIGACPSDSYTPFGTNYESIDNIVNAVAEKNSFLLCGPPFLSDATQNSRGIVAVYANEPPISPDVNKTIILYKNVITNMIVKTSSTLHSLAEFEPLTDVHVTTDIGKLLLQNISTVTQDNVKDVSKDVMSFMNVLSSMYKETPLLQMGTNRQRDLTRIFVEEFKRDHVESPAFLVIEKLNQYLKKNMEPGEINQTQMSTDIVDLGVKKTRKARGNMYGILSPTDDQIQSLTLRSLVR